MFRESIPLKQNKEKLKIERLLTKIRAYEKLNEFVKKQKKIEHEISLALEKGLTEDECKFFKIHLDKQNEVLRSISEDIDFLKMSLNNPKHIRKDPGLSDELISSSEFISIRK